MTAWHRNRDWSAEIEGKFERHLERCRDPEQMLKIQGYELLEREPAVAGRLLSRCADLQGTWAAAACLYLAQARLRLGDLQGALEALDRALSEETKEGRVRTGARTDWLLVVAMLGAQERYAEALTCLGDMHERAETLVAEEHAAEALIRADLGQTDTAQGSARVALAELKALRGDAPAPNPFFNDLLDRLELIGVG